MSLVFKPKIPKDFSALLPVKVVEPIDRKYKPRVWTDAEKDQLVELRAIGVSYYDCATMLRRGNSNVGDIISLHKLQDAISNLRQAHIDRIMK
jgi:hypothetical protein